MKIRAWGLAAASALLLMGPSAQAHEAGDWLLRVGVGMVDPKSNNGDVVSVDSGTSLVFNGTYMFTSNVGLEVLAAYPFAHDVKLVGGPKVAEVEHLPPTVSLQYHFTTAGAFNPYAGIGVNYTTFTKDKAVGDLAGNDLDLDSSFGVAAQLGFDYDLSDTMFWNVDVRWINIESDAELNDTPLETVEIDPLVYSLTLGWRF